MSHSVGQVKICLSVCLLSPQKPLSCAALAVRLVVQRHSYREPLRRESLKTLKLFDLLRVKFHKVA